MLLGALPPNATACRPEKSDTGRSMLRISCQTPAESRSDKVSTFRSASSRKSDGVELAPLTSAAAPTMRELLPAPLIWSFTVNAQLGLLSESLLCVSDL